MRIGIVAMMAAMAAYLTPPDARAQADCANWLSPDFFATAGAADVRACLRAGADPDARTENGDTPLHFAADEGHADVIETLLEAGADPDARDENGWTPLHIAARWGHVAAIMALLKGGADPDVRDKGGDTPLHIAAGNGNAAAIAALIEAGAAIPTYGTRVATPCCTMLRRKVMPPRSRRCSTPGPTPAHGTRMAKPRSISSRRIPR